MKTMTNQVTLTQMTLLPSTKLLVIVDGPTASGKTKVGVELASHFNSEIISADSRQFYKELKIGTARPDESELKEIPHHFLAFTSVTNVINAGRFEREAEEKINSLFETKDILFVVGGSGFYIDALLFGIDDIPPITEEIREKMIHEYEKHGLVHIQALLKALDPQLYETIDIQNPKRIIRGLEVAYQSGQKLSTFQKGNKNAKWPYLRIGLEWDREQLYERINQRVDQMIESGLVEEVKRMLPYKDLNSLRTVGYTELFPFFSNEIELEPAIELIKQNSRRYAKRQLTWLRNQTDTQWFAPDEIDKMLSFISEKRPLKK